MQPLRSLLPRVFILLLLALTSGFATDNLHYNYKARDYLSRVRGALAHLARSEVILHGIEVTKIKGVEGTEAALYVQQELVFRKNTGVNPSLAGSTGPVVNVVRREKVGPGGIIVWIGVSDHMPKIETTEVICLNPGAKNRIYLYLLVKVHEDTAMCQAILREIAPHTAMFLKSLGVPDHRE